MAHHVISLQSSALVAFGRKRASNGRQDWLAQSRMTQPQKSEVSGLAFLLHVLAWLQPLTRRLRPRFSCFEKLAQGLDLAMPVLPGCYPFDPRRSPQNGFEKFF